MSARPLPQSLSLPWDEEIPISSELCRDFERIEDEGDSFGVSDFFRKYKLNRYQDEDYLDVRRVLYCALALRSFITGGNVTEKDLAGHGVTFCDSPVKCPGGMPFRIAELSIPLNGEIYVEDLALAMAEPGYMGAYDIRDEKINRPIIEGEDPLGIVLENSLGRRSFLTVEELVGLYEDGEIGFERHPSARIALFSVGAGDLEDAPPAELDRMAATDLLEKLFLAHTRNGIRNGNRAGIHYQYSPHAIFALWLAYSNEFTHSRIDTCEACGKPLVIQGERGKKRKYCDGTCARWANRHKGEKRPMRVRS